jgi:hypothetical protein
MGTASWNDPNYTTNPAATYKANLDAVAKILKRMGNAYAAHEQVTPDLTARIEAGPIFPAGQLTEQAAQTVSGFTTPAANPRIDRVVLNPLTGACTRVAGTEAASPTAPAFAKNLLPVCQILFQTSSTVITNSMITDERVLISAPMIITDLGATSGTDTYTTTNANSPLNVWTTDAIYRAKFGNANTSTAPTLNPDALGAKTIKKGNSLPLSPGDIPAGLVALLHYNGTDLILLNPAKGVLRGKQTVWVPTPAMASRTTAGPGSTTTELATNKIMRRTLDFDPSTQEHAQFQIKMPKGWDEATITARFVWTFASGSGAVVWGIQAISHGDGDALDAAFGTGQEVTDTALTAGQEHLTAATSGMTVGGTPQPDDLVTFQVYRNAASGSDTLATDALLLGVELLINFDAADDS